jgi:hypothetical protein
MDPFAVPAIFRSKVNVAWFRGDLMLAVSSKVSFDLCTEFDCLLTKLVSRERAFLF